MSFILNEAVAPWARQAEPDSVDFDILIAAIAGSGVVSGGAITGTGGTIGVGSGTMAWQGTTHSFSATTLSVTPNATARPRFDLIVVSSSAVVSIVVGTAARTPVFPSLPANSVALWAVYVPPGVDTVNANSFVDKRVKPSTPAAIEGSFQMPDVRDYADLASAAADVGADGGGLLYGHTGLLEFDTIDWPSGVILLGGGPKSLELRSSQVLGSAIDFKGAFNPSDPLDSVNFVKGAGIIGARITSDSPGANATIGLNFQLATGLRFSDIEVWNFAIGGRHRGLWDSAFHNTRVMQCGSRDGSGLYAMEYLADGDDTTIDPDNFPGGVPVDTNGIRYTGEFVLESNFDGDIKILGANGQRVNTITFPDGWKAESKFITDTVPRIHIEMAEAITLANGSTQWNDFDSSNTAETRVQGIKIKNVILSNISRNVHGQQSVATISDYYDLEDTRGVSIEGASWSTNVNPTSMVRWTGANNRNVNERGLVWAWNGVTDNPGPVIQVGSPTSTVDDLSGDVTGRRGATQIQSIDGVPVADAGGLNLAFLGKLSQVGTPSDPNDLATVAWTLDNVTPDALRFGAGAPDPDHWNDGDLYLDTDAGDYYRKAVASPATPTRLMWNHNDAESGTVAADLAPVYDKFVVTKNRESWQRTIKGAQPTKEVLQYILLSEIRGRGNPDPTVSSGAGFRLNGNVAWRDYSDNIWVDVDTSQTSFTVANVDGGSNTLTTSTTHNLAAGTPVYVDWTTNPIGNLTRRGRYFVLAPGATTLKLSETVNGPEVNFDSATATGTRLFRAPMLIANPDWFLQNNEGGPLLDATTSGRVSDICKVDGTTNELVTGTPLAVSSVSTTNNTLTLPSGHGIVNGDPVYLTWTSGTLGANPSNIVQWQEYHATGVAATTIQLSATSSPLNAIDLTSNSTSGLTVYRRSAHGFGIDPPDNEAQPVFIGWTDNAINGLTRWKLYYVQSIPSTSRFTLSESPGGAAIDFDTQTNCRGIKVFRDATFFMDPASTGFRQFWIDQVNAYWADIQADANPANRVAWDGIMLDNAFLSLGTTGGGLARHADAMMQQRTGSTTVRNGSGTAYTHDTYTTAVANFLAFLKAELPDDMPLWANCVEERDNYTAAWEKYYPHLDGIMYERFATDWGAVTNDYASPETWEADLARVEEILDHDVKAFCVSHTQPPWRISSIDTGTGEFTTNVSSVNSSVTAHNLAVGDLVTLSWASGSITSTPQIVEKATYRIRSVPASNRFTLETLAGTAITISSSTLAGARVYTPGTMALQRFAQSSFLLVMQPGESWFRTTNNNGSYDEMWEFENDAALLGNPLGSRYIRTGTTWRRDFQNGYVEVDPVAQTSTIQVFPAGQWARIFDLSVAVDGPDPDAAVYNPPLGTGSTSAADGRTTNESATTIVADLANTFDYFFHLGGGGNTYGGITACDGSTGDTAPANPTSPDISSTSSLFWTTSNANGMEAGSKCWIVRRGTIIASGTIGSVTSATRAVLSGLVAPGYTSRERFPNVTAATDDWFTTASPHSYAVGDALWVSSITGTITIAGHTLTSRRYYVVASDPATNRVKLALTQGGTPLDVEAVSSSPGFTCSFNSDILVLEGAVRSPFGRRFQGTGASTLGARLKAANPKAVVAQYGNAGPQTHQDFFGIAAQLETTYPLSFDVWSYDEAVLDTANGAAVPGTITTGSQTQLRVRKPSVARPDGTPTTWPFKASSKTIVDRTTTSDHTLSCVNWIRVTNGSNSEVMGVSAVDDDGTHVILTLVRNMWNSRGVDSALGRTSFPTGSRIYLPTYVGTTSSSADSPAGYPGRDAPEIANGAPRALRYRLGLWANPRLVNDTGVSLNARELALEAGIRLRLMDAYESDFGAPPGPETLGATWSAATVPDTLSGSPDIYFDIASASLYNYGDAFGTDLKARSPKVYPRTPYALFGDPYRPDTSAAAGDELDIRRYGWLQQEKWRQYRATLESYELHDVATCFNSIHPSNTADFEDDLNVHMMRHTPDVDIAMWEWFAKDQSFTGGSPARGRAEVQLTEWLRLQREPLACRVCAWAKFSDGLGSEFTSLANARRYAWALFWLGWWGDKDRFIFLTEWGFALPTESWLAAPLGRPVGKPTTVAELAHPHVAFAGKAVFRRETTNGIVILNATTDPISVTAGTHFPNGMKDHSSVAGGVPIGANATLTIPRWDAVILAR